MTVLAKDISHTTTTWTEDRPEILRWTKELTKLVCLILELVKNIKDQR